MLFAELYVNEIQVKPTFSIFRVPGAYTKKRSATASQPWLPIRSRIDFKLGLLVYKCLHGIAPSYLVEMLQSKFDVPALSRLCSIARGDLVVARTLTKTFGPRSFSVAGASFWNSLPDYLRTHSLSIHSFKKNLKTFLFLQRV